MMITPLEIGEKIKGAISLHHVLVGFVSLAILVVAHYVFSRLSRGVFKFVEESDTPDGLKRSTALGMLESAIYLSLMAITVLIIFSYVGVEGAMVITILGSILFSVGLGLQGTLSDLAAGLMLMLSNAYKMGDYIEVLNQSDDINGTVTKFDLLHTTLLDDDSGIKLIVPNQVIYTNVIKNHSSAKKRVCVLNLTVSNRNEDLSGVLEDLRRAVQGHPKVLESPKVTCDVDEVNDLGTVVAVRYTIASSDYFTSGTYSVQATIRTLARRTIIDSGMVLVTRNEAVR
jgi:small conductance mechanosensitive channel